MSDLELVQCDFGDFVLLLLKLGIITPSLYRWFLSNDLDIFYENRSFAYFCAFCAEVKAQINASLHMLRSGNAKEYMSELIQS